MISTNETIEIKKEANEANGDYNKYASLTAMNTYAILCTTKIATKRHILPEVGL